MPSIHQETSFAAPPSRIFRVLTDSKQFAEATGAPATGDSIEGAAFSAFGGYVTGRHLELVADKRIVQAWRAKSWPDGVYSIVRFELEPEGKGTKLVFAHEAFPEDQIEHLAGGWRTMYWEKIAKHVS
jgi:activator of HSP90 ATPase